MLTPLEKLHSLDGNVIDTLVDTDPLALRDHLHTARAEIDRLTAALAASAPPF